MRRLSANKLQDRGMQGTIEVINSVNTSVPPAKWKRKFRKMTKKTKKRKKLIVCAIVAISVIVLTVSSVLYYSVFPKWADDYNEGSKIEFSVQLKLDDYDNGLCVQFRELNIGGYKPDINFVHDEEAYVFRRTLKQMHKNTDYKATVLKDGIEIGAFEKGEDTFFYKKVTRYDGVFYEDGKLYYFMMERLTRFKVIAKGHPFDLFIWSTVGRKNMFYAFDLKTGENTLIDEVTFLSKWQANDTIWSR